MKPTKPSDESQHTLSGPRRPDESLRAYENRKSLAQAERAERRRRREAELVREVAERAARNLLENRADPSYDPARAVDDAIPTRLLHTRLSRIIKARLTGRYPRGFSRPKGRAPDPVSPLRALKTAKALRRLKPEAISRSSPFAHIREMDLHEYQRIAPALAGGRAAGCTRAEAMLPAKARKTLRQRGLAPSVAQQIHEQTVTARVHGEAQTAIPPGSFDVLGNLVRPPSPAKVIEQKHPRSLTATNSNRMQVRLSELVPLAK